jgi:hypothetical protein
VITPTQLHHAVGHDPVRGCGARGSIFPQPSGRQSARERAAHLRRKRVAAAASQRSGRLRPFWVSGDSVRRTREPRSKARYLARRWSRFGGAGFLAPNVAENGRSRAVARRLRELRSRCGATASGRPGEGRTPPIPRWRGNWLGFPQDFGQNAGVRAESGISAKNSRTSSHTHTFYLEFSLLFKYIEALALHYESEGRTFESFRARHFSP